MFRSALCRQTHSRLGLWNQARLNSLAPGHLSRGSLLATSRSYTAPSHPPQGGSSAAALKPQDEESAEEGAESQRLINLEASYGAHNYHPVPVVFSKGEGVHIYDPEGKKYLDFLSAYSAVNQGHSHPKILKALVDQSQRLCLSSRAFYNDQFGEFAKYITQLFGYDRVLPMNTGAEAVETAIKLARKWGYKKKGIPANKAIVLSASNNFHGRTLGIVSMSTDPTATEDFGPFLPRVGPIVPKTNKVIRYNNIEDLEEAFELHGSELAGLLLEPIQGEAGIIVPSDEYLQKAHALCRKHNVLFIADEVQTGLGRTGKMLAIEYANIRPDVVILGKALSGGVYPVSAVLADDDVMLTIQPGEHGSTYGGNPLAAAVATAALKVLVEEDLSSKAYQLGNKFRSELKSLNSPLLAEIRGRGLLNAIVVNEANTEGRSAWDLCLLLKQRGLLAKPTHRTIIRLAPPLTITEAELMNGVNIIKQCLHELPTAPISGE